MAKQYFYFSIPAISIFAISFVASWKCSGIIWEYFWVSLMSLWPKSSFIPPPTHH